MSKRLIRLRYLFRDRKLQFQEKFIGYFLEALPYRIRIEVTDFQFCR